MERSSPSWTLPFWDHMTMMDSMGQVTSSNINNNNNVVYFILHFLFYILYCSKKAYKYKTSKPNNKHGHGQVMEQIMCVIHRFKENEYECPKKQTLMEQLIKRVWQSAAPVGHNKDK